MTEHTLRPIAAEDFKKLDIYSDPQIAPDGSGYVFVSTKVKDDDSYESQLFFQNLSETNPQQWTFHKSKQSHPRFSPDGKSIVFQSDRSGVPQLWLLPVEGGEARQLTTFKNGAVNPEWSKDGKFIIFTAMLEADDDVERQKELSKEERQKEAQEKKKQPIVIDQLKHKSDASGFRDAKRSQIVLYDIDNESFTQLTSADADHGFLDISPDGQTILFAANLNEQADRELINDIYKLDTASKQIEKLTNGKGSYGGGVFSPCGTKVAVVGHEQQYAGATLNDLYVYDLKTNERTCLSSDWDFPVGDLMIGDTRLGASEAGPVWSEDGETLYFIGTDRGATGLHSVTLNGELSTLYNRDNHVFGFSYHKSSHTFIIGVSTPVDPGNFYKLGTDGMFEQITMANAGFLADVHLAVPEELTVTAEDGWEIQGWLLKPYGFEEGKKYPFVLEIHGGPHMMYGQSFFHEMQLLAAKGYVVLYTNPRGSHGYGQHFVDACREDYGGKDYTDLMSAVDYALENYSFIDEERLGVTGGSYGGFMTNWIVGHTNRFKAAVTQRSISNWLSFYGVSDIGFFFTKWEHGLNLLDDPEKLWDFSPLKYAANVETPLLIVHGEQDLRCPIEQGEQLFITLKHLEKEVEFVRFPGANHELSRSGAPYMRIERLNHILRWFETYL
ncbi:Acylaminoacyl-peptidase [Lentibacillus sp. JNUCC-1]|uniref:S9 family peptidase n=1 Tax=Lentibacillus sp. JNUCC-1 TaxID=2654513 RepID=UPI0012E957EE|nr:S9 family peptidase [Lentibacillus sp. JNUCC-1]MUV36666.1 Acylaminoacyl-peptidase [Lentibacillus sp. JNUCC-1]